MNSEYSFPYLHTPIQGKHLRVSASDCSWVLLSVVGWLVGCLIAYLVVFDEVS